MKRIVYAVLGWVFVIIGIIGAFLPLLPTTPFLILAAACWARSSPRWRARLLATPGFGPAIQEWEESRTIPLRAKLMAIGMITVSCAGSVLFACPSVPGKVCLVIIAASTSTWMWRVPTRGGDSATVQPVACR